MSTDVSTLPGHQIAPQASADWRGMLRIGHFIVFALLGGFVIWAATARLDGAAVAAGVLEAESSRRTIQHLEGGIVKEILVRNGDHVALGQPLIRLDPLRTEAQADLYKNQLSIMLAQEARLVAEYSMSPTLLMPAEVLTRAAQPLVAPVVADQDRLFRSRRDELVRNLAVADSEISQARKDIDQNQVDLTTAEATRKNITKELDSLRPLYERQLVATTRVAPLEREKLRLEGVIEGNKVQALKLAARHDELRLKRELVQQTYHKEASTALIDLRKMINDVRQQIVLSEDSRKRTDLLAPIAGTVQQLRVFTVGGVVRPGDPILDIAPVNEELTIRAQIQPDDVDRVALDMGAEIRFPAFNYWGDRVIRGHIRSISQDRIVENEGRNVYFAAEVVVDKTTLPPEIEGHLMAGMGASVVFSTGKRTVAEYLLNPLTERFNKSMRER